MFQTITEFIWQEGESFVSSARKAFGISNVIISPFAMAYGIYWVWLGFTIGVPDQGKSGTQESAGAGTIVEGVLSLLLGCILVTNAFIMKLLGGVSDLHCTSLMWSLLLPVLGATFCVPEFGNRSLLLWYSIQCVVAQSSHAPVQCTLAFVGQMISGYNDAYYQTFPLYLPGARLNGPPLEVLGELLGSTVVVNSIVLAIYLQGKVYRETYNEAKSLAGAKAAQELTIELVQMLRRYDLDGVGQTLAYYRDSEIDPQLLKNFAHMKSNLEHYRPHLPNYVFIEADRLDRDNDEHRHSVFALPPPNLLVRGGGGRTGPLNESPRGSGERSNTPTSDHPNITVHNDADGENATARRSKDYHRTTRETSSPTGDQVTEVGALETGSLDPGDDHSFLMTAPSEGQRTPDENSLTPAQGIIPAVPTFAFGSRKITFALVDCHRLTRNHQERELRHFVNTIFAIANDTQASVHTFLGDVVQVTWNATSRIKQHELKAAKFLGRLSREATVGNYSVAGAACSGPVRCFNVAANLNLQRALLVHNVWQGALRSLFNLASRFKANIIDAPTHAVAHYDIECRGIDILQCSGWEENQEPSYELLVDKTCGVSFDRTVGGPRVNVAETSMSPQMMYQPGPAPARTLEQLPGQPLDQGAGSPLVSAHGGFATEQLPVPRPNMQANSLEDGGQQPGQVRLPEDIRSPSMANTTNFGAPNLFSGSASPGVAQFTERSGLGGAVAPLRSAHAHHDGSKLASSSFVYEITMEQFGGKTKDQDWQLQQQRAAQTSPNAAINGIIESIASGQIAQALTRLHELQSGSQAEKMVVRAPLVQRLFRHCEVALAARDPNAPGSSAQ